MAEGDIVALSNKPLSSNPTIIISKPLVHDGTTPARSTQIRGRQARSPDAFEMNDIIGKGQRDYVISAKGMRYMLHEPTLAEYVTHCARLVTPVGLAILSYHSNANFRGNRFTLTTQTLSSLSLISIRVRQAHITA